MLLISCNFFSIISICICKNIFLSEKSRTLVELCCSICQFKNFFFVHMSFGKKCCEKATTLRTEIFSGTNFQVIVLPGNFFHNFCPQIVKLNSADLLKLVQSQKFVSAKFIFFRFVMCVLVTVKLLYNNHYKKKD